MGRKPKKETQSENNDEKVIKEEKPPKVPGKRGRKPKNKEINEIDLSNVGIPKVKTDSSKEFDGKGDKETNTQVDPPRKRGRPKKSQSMNLSDPSLPNSSDISQKRKASRSPSIREIKKKNQKLIDETDYFDKIKDDGSGETRKSLRSKKPKNETEESIFTEIDDDSLFSHEESIEDFSSIKEGVHKIFSHRETDDGREFFVKLQNLSYKSSQWVNEIVLLSTKSGQILLDKYLKKFAESPPQPPYYNPSFEIPEKIIAKRIIEGTEEFLVKWTGLEYEFNTWESRDSLNDETKIQEFVLANKLPSLQERFTPSHPASTTNWKPISTVPPSKNGHQPRPYQMEGLNFLAKSWFYQRNAILADEMGLGKTIQTLLFLRYIGFEYKIRGPFLIVVPLSTILQWEREIKEWTNYKALTFSGSQIKRNLMREYEFFYDETNYPKFNILLTTYEYIIREQQTFSTLNWQCIVVDEAHRLKNHQSRLISILRTYNSSFKLLLTGTPLQNNTGELWSLLNFLDEKAFNSMNDFQERFGQLNETEQIVELQSILKPLMLRRLKSDVEKAIAPLEEVIIECGMTQHQKGYYQSIFNKNMEYLTRGAHRTNSTNLHNIFMELRKVCNHPYLIKGAEEQILIERKEMLKIGGDDIVPTDFDNESLIRSSGKMILLDKLLAKLKTDGHRVLIFSQMTRVLDILQDYLNYRGYLFERLDGSIRGEDRQAGIDRYNAPNSQIFVFLLCTHAGGLGINLTSADTVIIYDSDWNPQNDIQATARCHRIGQTKEVKVYRFLTAKSYERKMFDRAALKLGLDHAVLESSKIPKSEELEKLIRLGAYYAFEDDNNAEADKFGEEDIESIISKSLTIRHVNIAAGEGSTFSKAHFEVDNDNNVDLSAPDFWQKYLPVVVEDEGNHGLSIAERRRMRRDDSQVLSSQSQEFDDEECSSPLSDSKFYWNRKKIQSVMANLWRYGWGRWRIILETTDFQCEVAEIKSVSRVILGWLLEACPDQFPIIDAIYKMSQSDDTKSFEKRFIKKHKLEMQSIVISNANWKLSRLETLHFLNSAVQTCTNPPNDLVVGNVYVSKPADWWTSIDDKILMHGIYQNGFRDYESIKFTNSGGINYKLLPQRLKSIINGLKATFMKFKESKGIELPFNYETLRMLEDSISKKDHRHILFYLQNYGFTTMEEFQEVSGLTSKSMNSVSDYVSKLLKFCEDSYNKNEKISSTEFAEKVFPGQAQRIQQRIKFFQDIREICDENKYTGDDMLVLSYIAEHGFLDINDCPKLTELLGQEPSEAKLVKRVKDILRSKDRKVEIIHVAPITIPDYEQDEDGNPILPLRISSSLVLVSMGNVVFDRPGFHSNRYIYPDGYCAERLYTSVTNPSEKAWYRSSIVDTGGETPVFRVEMAENPKMCFEGNAPSNPWMNIIKAIETKLKSHRSLTVSGPDFFGLSTPIVQHLMQRMENIDKCDSFIKREYSETKESTRPTSLRPPRPQRSSRRTVNYQTDESSSDSSSSSNEEEVSQSTKIVLKPNQRKEDPKIIINFALLLQKARKDEPQSDISFQRDWINSSNPSNHLNSDVNGFLNSCIK